MSAQDADYAPHYWVGDHGVATGGNVPEKPARTAENVAKLDVPLDQIKSVCIPTP